MLNLFSGIKVRNRNPYRLAVILIFSVIFQSLMPTQAANLSFRQAVVSAYENDYWLQGSQHRENMFESKSIAAGELPNPKLSLGLLNVPTDTFDFDQEPMTQLKIGVSQQFARGDTLNLKREQLLLKSQQQPIARQQRRADIKLALSQLWLDAYKASETITLIERNRGLFKQLEDIAKADYSSALGKTRQQDIVKSQLELTRFDDRLAIAITTFDHAISRLSEWLPTDETSKISMASFERKKVVENFKWKHKNWYRPGENINQEEFFTLFSAHPAIRYINSEIEASNKSIDIAKQSYKPQWGINAGYGYRSNADNGNNRADFLSIGVTLDLPLFTSTKQDKQVSAAIKNTQAISTEKLLALRKMVSQFTQTQSKLHNLSQRQDLYKSKLLPQAKEQTDISMTAYTNDDGNLTEVTRARIAELNAEIEMLAINVERLKSIAQWNYFFEKGLEVSDVENSEFNGENHD